MSDPLSRAASKPPAMLGEGCTRRYDPNAMDDEYGAEFAGAAKLWQQLQADQMELPQMESTAPEESPR